MYIKIYVRTSTEIAYANRNRRSSNAIIQLYARYSTNYSTIRLS